MKNSTRIWLLAGIMILASFFRLYHITTTPPGLYPDEAMDGNNALEVIQTGHFQSFYTEDNGREGLYVNILVFFIKILGNKPWVVRLPAAIAGIFTVLGMYFLVDELFKGENLQCTMYQPEADPPRAENLDGNVTKFGNRKLKIENSSPRLLPFLAAFFLATSFWHINFSRIGFRAILAPLCLIWALYWFLKAIKIGNRKLKIENFPWSLVFAILAGIVFGLGFYTYIAYRVAPLLFLLFIPFFRKYPNFWKRAALFVVVAFVVALPIGVYFIQHPADFFGRTSEISVTNAVNPVHDLAVNILKTALMFNIHGDNNWRQNISGAPELWWPVGILFLLGIFWSIYFLWRGTRKNFQFPISNLKSNSNKQNDKSENLGFWEAEFGIYLISIWFLLGALPAVISDEGIPHALRSLLMLPPAIIFAAIGGVWVYRRIWDMGYGVLTKRVINIFAVIFIIAAVWNAYYSYFIMWAKNPNVPGAFNADYVAIGNEINALPSSTPKYVIVNAGGVLARGIPMPAETVMFVTDSFTTSTQLTNHITYLLPNQTSQIPQSTPSSTIFQIN